MSGIEPEGASLFLILSITELLRFSTLACFHVFQSSPTCRGCFSGLFKGTTGSLLLEAIRRCHSASGWLCGRTVELGYWSCPPRWYPV